MTEQQASAEDQEGKAAAEEPAAPDALIGEAAGTAAAAADQEPAPDEASGPIADGGELPAGVDEGAPAAEAAPAAEGIPAEVAEETPPQEASGAQAPAPAAETPAAPSNGGAPAAPPQGKRPPRPREPLPWPELRAAATAAAEGVDVNELKELFRLLPNEVREETIEGVREYRKGARRPVSAYAGKALARAVHTARRARRNPAQDGDVAEAMGLALAAEIVASLDVEIAAEVILPKRDLLDRQAKQARRQARDEEMRSRDEKRRRAREEHAGSGDAAFGTFSGPKIRGLDELKKLLETQEESKDS